MMRAKGHYIPTGEQDSNSILKALLLGAVAGAASGVGAYSYAWAIEPNWLDVVKVKLTLPNLPEEFDGYRVAQISDIHAGKWMPGARAKRSAFTRASPLTRACGARSNGSS